MEFKRFTNEHEYFAYFSVFDISSDELPVYISEDRKDLIPILEKAGNYYDRRSQIFKSNYAIILSNGVEKFQQFEGFAENWIKDSPNEMEKILKNTSITIIGYYKDFTQDKVLELLELAQLKNLDIYFLVARDLSSLSWLITKQFLDNTQSKKALFSHKKLNNSFSDWEIFDIRKLESIDIKDTIQTNEWESLVFHGHGKEDHLNLADYTLSGLNQAIPQNERFAPSIGHFGQDYFKDIEKAIQLDGIKVKNLILLSCNNYPFSNNRLYDSRYNLVLNAIDGYAKNIIASLSVQSADLPEIDTILNDRDNRSLVSRLHSKLSDIQLFPSLIMIGLPLIKNDSLDDHKEVIDEKATRLTYSTKKILSRISSYTGSLMLTKNHEINRLATKIWSDYVQNIRRGTFGVTEEDAIQFEKALINRVNPFSKKIIEIMLENQSDDLQEFDNFNIYRSIADSKTIHYGKCDCGGRTITYQYKPEIESLFPIESTYCYRCGDKQTKMIDMPKITFVSDEYNQNGMKIHYQIKITPTQIGDVYFAIQLPSYVENSVVNPDKLHRIRFKNIRTEIIEGDIEFKNDTILQSYYLKLILVQNGGLSFNRTFFNLVESDNKAGE